MSFSAGGSDVAGDADSQMVLTCQTLGQVYSLLGIQKAKLLSLGELNPESKYLLRALEAFLDMISTRNYQDAEIYFNGFFGATNLARILDSPVLEFIWPVFRGAVGFLQCRLSHLESFDCSCSIKTAAINQLTQVFNNFDRIYQTAVQEAAGTDDGTDDGLDDGLDEEGDPALNQTYKETQGVIEVGLAEIKSDIKTGLDDEVSNAIWYLRRRLALVAEALARDANTEATIDDAEGMAHIDDLIHIFVNLQIELDALVVQANDANIDIPAEAAVYAAAAEAAFIAATEVLSVNQFDAIFTEGPIDMDAFLENYGFSDPSSAGGGGGGAKS